MTPKRDLVLFSGAGGTTEGLVRAGWNVAACVDGWDKACDAHRLWHPGIPVVQARVESLPLRGPFRFCWSSPSCKPWSTANRTQSRGERHREYYSLPQLAEQCLQELGAQWLVIENVGGLIWSREGVVEVAKLAKWASVHGYAMSQPKNGLLPSNTFGVEQLRRRVFIVLGPHLVSLRPGGVLLPTAGTEPLLWETGRAQRPVLADHGRPPDKDHGWNSREPVMSIDGDPTRTGYPKRAGAGVVGDEHGRVNGAARLRASRGVVDASNASRHRKRNHLDGYGLKRAERAVKATEHVGSLEHEERGQPGFGRSLEECARLQQIPMHILAGFSKRVAHELVGNCVPPPVAEHIGRVIMEAAR